MRLIDSLQSTYCCKYIRVLLDLLDLPEETQCFVIHTHIIYIYIYIYMRKKEDRIENVIDR